MDKTFIFMANGKKSLGNKIQPKSYFGNPYSTWFWEYLLQQSIHTDPTLSAHKNGEHWFESFENAKVHIQWDPERNLKGTKLEQRSIQIGISRFLIQAFNNTAIHSIQDI